VVKALTYDSNVDADDLTESVPDHRSGLSIHTTETVPTVIAQPVKQQHSFNPFSKAEPVQV
jgi:hypothetical protein